MMPLRTLPLGLLCTFLLAGCQPGNSLKSFSGRELRAGLRPPTGDGALVFFSAELVLKAPESGCLQLHPGVEADLSGIELQVNPGVALTRDGPCGDPEVPPSFFKPLDTQLFFGEPRNAVLEVRDGDDRIVAEFTNFFARHSFAQMSPPPTVKPGEEISLPWDPPTDDLTVIEEVLLGDRLVPARPEAGGVRFTVPADFPAGSALVSARASNIPAERCEGVAVCTAFSLLILPRVATITVQP